MGLFGASASSLTASCSVRKAAHILLSGRWPAPAAGTLARSRIWRRPTPLSTGYTAT
ncbi:MULTISPECIES: hypothetical protein [Neokomagataea]|uniref:Uncharacterized protein n=1 Tax=Neokomagataea anthophila TaxID=2826925 RepID=A0ABS5E985_9PROT|nr:MULTISPECIES: hypothetical protein [Neokomagataea]MBR0560471.1 hypothetical protein [Neokomagataea anthophila]